MALTYLDQDKVQAIVNDYWNTVFQLSPYYQPTGYDYSLTDTPASQPVFGTATWSSGWNKEGTANGVTGVVAVNVDNRSGELGNGAPALMIMEAEYDTSQGYSASFSKSEAVTKSFQFGVNATFLGIGSSTFFGISGTSTWGSGTTDNHVTTTSQDESFTFTTPVGKEYQGQVWHTVETVELPFTIDIHVSGSTEGEPTIGVPIDPLGYAVSQPIGPVFAWAHDQGPGGPAGDDYVNYAQDPTNPNAGIYTLHGTLTAYSGGVRASERKSLRERLGSLAAAA